MKNSTLKYHIGWNHEYKQKEPHIAVIAFCYLAMAVGVFSLIYGMFI